MAGRNSCQQAGSYQPTRVAWILSDILQKFGDHLRELRLGRQISQEKLAAEAGLHRTYVSSVERGERNISLLNIERLALALKVPLKEMIPSPDTKRRGGR